MGTFLIIMLLVAGLWWFGRYIDEGSKQMDEDLDRAFENKEQRIETTKKLGDWLDRH